MPTNEDRFWDVAIGEAVTGRQPPDLVAIILGRLIEPAHAARALPHPRWRRFAGRALQGAVAAGVLLAIGVATGLLKWERPDPDNPLPEIKNLIAVPDAKWRQEGDAAVLESGALLLSTGSPEVRCAESTFAIIDGLALVRAGQAPTPEQQATLNAWLETKGVEADMIRNATKWLQGTALCALMLHGSATLDGQKVEAEKPPAEPVWYRVNNVMDIDKLPRGVTHVSADDLSCPHLDFLADIPTIQAISIRNGTAMRVEHLAALSKLPGLVQLDLLNVEWADDELASYEPLLELKTLRKLTIDPLARSSKLDEQRTPEEKLQEALNAISALDTKGVEIELGWIDAREVKPSRLVEALPNLRGLQMYEAVDSDLKAVARLAKLDSLTVSSHSLSDAGIAYLARGTRITSFTLHFFPQMALPVFHQLGKVSSLKRLTLKGSVSGIAGECLEQLSNLKALTELDLTELETSNSSQNLGQADFAKFPPLQQLKMDYEAAPILAALPQLKSRIVLVQGKYNFSMDNFEVGEPPKNDGSAVETLLIKAGALDTSADANIERATQIFAACPKLTRIEVKHVKDCTPVMVEPFLALLRKAAPKATVVYVP